MHTMGQRAGIAFLVSMLGCYTPSSGDKDAAQGRTAQASTPARAPSSLARVDPYSVCGEQNVMPANCYAASRQPDREYFCNAPCLTMDIRRLETDLEREYGRFTAFSLPFAQQGNDAICRIDVWMIQKRTYI